MSKIAVVTGSNKGIGFQVVKDLAKQFDGLVYLTGRDWERGEKALSEAQRELGSPAGDRLRFHLLDVSDKASIQQFGEFIKKEHGHLNILVNNAGIAYKQDSTAPFAEQAKVTNDTNYFGLKNVCEALFPLLAPGARVVNVASRVGTMTIRNCSDEIRAAFVNAAKAEDVDALVSRFVQLAQEGKHKEAGFADTSYGMSKLGVIALSAVQAKALAVDKERPDIILNAVCPGYVDTDMTSHKGHLTVAEGADSLTWLALLPPNDSNNPVGQMVAERKVINWQVGQTREEAFGKQ